MKKTKIFKLLLVVAMILSMPIVYAHNVTLAGDNIIPIPEKLNSLTKIQVAESFGEYKMYYQWVAMSEEDYNSYMEYLDLQSQVENPGADATDEEKQDYEEQLMLLEEEKIKVKPSYDNNKWTETKDGTVPFNEKLEGVETGDPFVLWIKAVSAEDESNVIYEERLILYQSNLVKEEKEENAQTSDGILVVGLLSIAALGFMAVSYKKSRA